MLGYIYEYLCFPKYYSDKVTYYDLMRYLNAECTLKQGSTLFAVTYLTK